LIGKHIGHPKVRTQPFQTMTIEATTPIPVAADGEYLGLSRRITVSVQAEQLRVVKAHHQNS
jgi:diacylglycerol kinase (ATP)